MNIPSDMQRTSCDCRKCTVGCKTMPGCLAPGDIERIQEHVGDNTAEFVLEHFRVSDGAKCAKKVGINTIVFSVPSLVPAQQPDGRCVFLTDDDRCQIHPVSPFGCSHCDTHLSREEGDRRMNLCVTEQIKAHQQNASYSKWCSLLDQLQLRAAPLLERRTAFNTLFEGMNMPYALNDICNKEVTNGDKGCRLRPDELGWLLDRWDDDTNYAVIKYATRVGVVKDIFGDMEKFLGKPVEQCRVA